MIYKKNVNKFLLLLISLCSTWCVACLPDHHFNDIQLKEMFRDEILNNVRKTSSYFNFSDCDLQCVVNTLNEKNINSTISGSVITFKTTRFGLSTMVVDDPKARTLSGYLTCNARGNWQYIKIPLRLSRAKVVMDFQATDALNISRTVSLINVSRQEYLSQMMVIKNQSLGVESAKGYKSANLKNGNKVLIVDAELSRGKVTYVFIQQL
jgi:hypothetical protein